MIDASSKWHVTGQFIPSSLLLFTFEPAVRDA